MDLESQSRASVAEGEGADENGDEDDESASQSVEQSTQSPAPGRTSAMPESGDDEEDEEAEDEEDDGFDYEAGAGTGANSDISADHWRVHPDTDEVCFFFLANMLAWQLYVVCSAWGSAAVVYEVSLPAAFAAALGVTFAFYI